jgi:hypothetical protein
VRGALALLAVLAGLAPGRPAGARRALEVRDGAGREVFTIKWMDDGAKLVDPREQELARLKPREDRVKITGPDDAAIGAVSGDAAKIKVEGADRAVLLVLRRQSDGDYKLEDAHDTLQAKLKVKGADAVRVEDAGGATLFKAKRKGGKLVITDATELPVLTAEGTASLMGFAVLGLQRLTPPQRAALLYRLDALGVP